MTDLAPTVAALSALAQDTRLRAFRLLMAAWPEGVAAGDLAKALMVAPNALSAHLSVLAHAGLVTAERDGRRILYRAEVSAVTDLVRSLVETCCHGRPEVCAALTAVAEPAGDIKIQ